MVVLNRWQLSRETDRGFSLVSISATLNIRSKERKVVNSLNGQGAVLPSSRSRVRTIKCWDIRWVQE